MYYLAVLVYLLFPRQKDFCGSKMVSLSLHTLVPGRCSHNLLPISTVRFPKQFKPVKTPPLVHTFDTFSFRRSFPPLRNSQQSCHRTCRWRAVHRQPPPCPHPVLCFQPSQVLFSFIFKKSLFACCWTAAEQMLQYYVSYLSFLSGKTQCSGAWLGQNYFFMAFGYSLNTYIELWRIIPFQLCYITSNNGYNLASAHTPKQKHTIKAYS